MIRRPSLVLTASAVIGLAACGGGGSGSPNSPGGGGNASPPAGEAATVGILPSGVSLKVVTVPRGSRVNFANQSGNNIEISSDPHPIHTDCPALNIGTLRSGQTGQTGEFNTARTCTYHDHGRDQDERWQGSIVIR
jgi:hypothetical protein